MGPHMLTISAMWLLGGLGVAALGAALVLALLAIAVRENDSAAKGKI